MKNTVSSEHVLSILDYICSRSVYKDSLKNNRKWIFS